MRRSTQLPSNKKLILSNLCFYSAMRFSLKLKGLFFFLTFERKTFFNLCLQGRFKDSRLLKVRQIFFFEGFKIMEGGFWAVTLQMKIGKICRKSASELSFIWNPFEAPKNHSKSSFCKNCPEDFAIVSIMKTREQFFNEVESVFTKFCYQPFWIFWALPKPKMTIFDKILTKLIYELSQNSKLTLFWTLFFGLLYLIFRLTSSMLSLFSLVKLTLKYPSNRAAHYNWKPIPLQKPSFFMLYLTG